MRQGMPMCPPHVAIDDPRLLAGVLRRPRGFNERATIDQSQAPIDRRAAPRRDPGPVESGRIFGSQTLRNWRSFRLYQSFGHRTLNCARCFMYGILPLPDNRNHVVLPPTHF
jgi:hypothetical protein